MRRHLDRNPLMSFIDKKTATLGAKAAIITIGIFIGILVILWWFEVFKFFLYDHWKPTLCFVVCCLAWYAIGLAIQQFEKRARRMHVRRHADPNYYGDDDCA